MRNLTWPAVALVAVLGGLSVALLSLTPLSATEVMGIVAVLAGVGGGAAVASAASGDARQVAADVAEIRAETTGQTQTLDTVARRVNGELDGRIKDAVDQGAADLIKLLRLNGVIK